MGFKVASRVRGLSDESFREAFGTKEQCRSALVRLRWPGEPRPERWRGGETGSEPSSARRDTHQYVAGLSETGKSWIACALAHTELRIAHGEGSIPRLYRDFARVDLLVLNDWGLAPVDATRRRDPLEILDDASVADQ